MSRTRLAPPILVMMMMMMIVMTLRVRTCKGLADVTVDVSYEGSSNYMIKVIFMWDKFAQFYQCLCSNQPGSCNAKYSAANNQVESINYVQSNDGRLQGTCGIFKCSNSGQSSSLVCNRINLQHTSCSELIKPTFIQLQSATSCAVTCVGISWSLSKENLVINNSQSDVTNCNNKCCSGTSIPTSSTSSPLASISVPNLTLLPGNSQSTEAYNVSQWQMDKSETTYTETIIISGVAAGIIFVAVVIFVVIVILKRKSTATSSTSRNNKSSWLSFGNVANRHKESNNSTPNEAKGFPHNLFTSQCQNNGAANFGFFGKITGQGRRGGGEGSQNWSHTGQEGSFVDVGRNSSNEETEYAVIDEAQMQPDHRLCINSNTVNTSTDPSFSESTNDGYSTLDSVDYYNIKEPAVTFENSHKSENECQKIDKNESEFDFKELQLQRAKNVSPLTPKANELSEYSVAKCVINDDTEKEDNSGIDQRGPQVPSAEISRGQIDTSERPHRLTLRSLNELSEGGSIAIVEGQRETHTLS